MDNDYIFTKEEIDFFRKRVIKLIHKIKQSLLTAKIENKVNSKVNGVQKLFLNEKFAIILSYSLSTLGYVLIRTIFRTSNTLTPFKSIDKVRQEIRQIDYSKLNREKSDEINKNNDKANVFQQILLQLDIIEDNIKSNDLELLKFMKSMTNSIQKNNGNGTYRFGESFILILSIIQSYGLLQNFDINTLDDYFKSFVTNINIRTEVSKMYQDYSIIFDKKTTSLISK